MEQFNNHQADVRGRVDTLAKSVFLLSGGALTLSISIFLRDASLQPDPCVLLVLKTSWWSLFYSMVGFIIVIGLIIIRDYIFAERWRAQMKSDNPKEINDSPSGMDAGLWIFGLTATLAFIYGFGALAYVAQSLVSGRA